MVEMDSSLDGGQGNISTGRLADRKGSNDSAGKVSEASFQTSSQSPPSRTVNNVTVYSCITCVLK